MVTVCRAFQLSCVNVNDAGDTVPSSVSLLLKSIATSSVGSEFKTIVKSAWPPASVVSPLTALTVIPALSLSVFVTDTLSGFIPS